MTLPYNEDVIQVDEDLDPLLPEVLSDQCQHLGEAFVPWTGTTEVLGTNMSVPASEDSSTCDDLDILIRESIPWDLD